MIPLFSARLRVFRRSSIASGLQIVVILVLAVIALRIGDYPLRVGDVVAALVGQSNDPLATYFVSQMRAPRVLLAIIVGAALGASGALFQSLTRNPLGSPDITGFTVGSASGALILITVFAASPGVVSVGAILGGFVAGAIVYLLSRREGINGMTFVLVGMGLSFSLQALNSLLLVAADLSTAQTAAYWMAGSFSAASWNDVALMGLAMVVLLPLAGALGRPSGIMESGDDLAQGLGINVNRRRTQSISVGVLLVALAVGAAGPISFVALAAPQIARIISNTPTVPVVPSALTGAVLVLASDILAQRLFAPTQLPVGIVTGCLGGVYLVWLLYRQWKKE